MSSNVPEMMQNSNGLHETSQLALPIASDDPTIRRPPTERPGRVQFVHRDNLDRHDRRPTFLPDDDDLEIGRRSVATERSALLLRSMYGNRYGLDHEDAAKLDAKSVLAGVAGTLVVLGILVLATFVGTGEYRSLPMPIPPHHSIYSVSDPPLPSDQLRNQAYLVKATHGAVASEHTDCSHVGVDLLKEGGNAVDAAIATNLCIGTLNMFSSGIGGGGFAIIRIPPSHPFHSQSSSHDTPVSPTSSEVYTVDFRETAPSLSNGTMFPPNTIKSRFGGLSVGVPGELKGLWEMHSRWGKAKWERLFEPSIQMARGWKVGTELARRLQNRGKLFMLDDPDWNVTFAPNGKLLGEGEILRRPEFSKTLERIAKEGVEAFYTGDIASSILRKIASKGGIMTSYDLLSYKPIIARAVEGSYRGRKVYTTHAPTSGPVLLHILNILEAFDLVGEGRTGTNVHRFVEALKFGFAGRTKVADPAFMKDTTEITRLLTKEFGQLIAANVTDDTTHEPDYYHPVYDVKEDHGTTHTSVVDSDGMVVGLTSSINLIFGSRVLDPATGIIFNDEMDDFGVPNTPNDFGLRPSPYNYPAPGKRPLSSITPTIVEKSNGAFHIVAGGSGGSRIFGSIIQTILNVDWGMDISSAIEQARVHDQLFPRELSVETTINNEELRTLKEVGHNVQLVDIREGKSEVQAIHGAHDGTIYAASDSRKNGIAAGY